MLVDLDMSDVLRCLE